MNILKAIDKKFSEYVENKTVYYRKELNFAPEETTTHNNKSDAFKHTFTSAILTYFLGRTICKYFTNNHEWTNLESGGPVIESIMDFYNNSIGRQIGTSLRYTLFSFINFEENIAKACTEKIRNDRAICSLNDPRIEMFINKVQLLESQEDQDRLNVYIDKYCIIRGDK